MLFQCSARLTLIWLSGSALLPCQAVWAVVKLFEGGLSRGVACLCQDETRLRGCKTSVCSQTPSLSLFCTPAVFFFFNMLPASAPSVTAFFLLPLSCLPPLFKFCVSPIEGQAQTHMHSFPPLSVWSLIKGIMTVWFGGNSDCCFAGFSPKLIKQLRWRFFNTLNLNFLD